ncbi:YncE family protein [Desulfosediminicola flagellatus]|uniref:YncE family protein n=1 Tax=Desulfosediminicola flagellatus TaxID=2569541 RepID=UPI0010ABAA49|nr:hypothetical protein [Desulfosediminicola flagellatus]
MRLTPTLVACMALFLGASPALSETVAQAGRDQNVEWQVRSSWQLDSKPIDIVHSLDGNRVFILDAQQRVLIYDNKGELQGRMPVGEGVTAIDIAPQGEALYLIDEKANSFTSLQLSFVHDIDVTGSPFKGKADAPVTIAVFTDFE